MSRAIYVMRPGHPLANHNGMVDVRDLDGEPDPTSSQRVDLVSDRFMEGASTQEGVDIGSRSKRREYMRATGSADASDYSPKYFEQRRAARDKQAEETTRKTVAEVAKIDRRHLPKFIEEGKKR